MLRKSCTTGYFRTHGRATLVQLAESVEEPCRRGLLQQISAGSGAHGGEDPAVIVVGGEDEEEDIRDLLLEDADTIDAGHARQADIDKSDARRRGLDGRDGGFHRGKDTGDAVSGCAADQHRQPFADFPHVFDDSYLQHSFRIFADTVGRILLI
jgi:hypothetical protein